MSPLILVIHHTAEEAEEQLAATERNHAARGYSTSLYGSSVCYTFFVGKDGTVVQNRKLEERPYCTQNSVINGRAISIAAAGDFNVEKPQGAQLAAIRALIERLDAIYEFEEIIGHADASPTACPGKYMTEALSDLRRSPKGEWQVWKITRYYTPHRHQERYFRSVGSTAELLDKAWEFGVVTRSGSSIIHHDWGASEVEFVADIGKTNEEAIAFIDANPLTKFLMKREVEYRWDFSINCAGDCLDPSDSGPNYTEADAFKVVACPPEYAFGTKFEIEGIGVVTCRDRGGAIKEKKLDVWAGVGVAAIEAMNRYPGWFLRVRQLPPTT